MAQVKLILLDDVENLGLAGDEVTVSPGYARNYLLPRGLAAKATPGIMRIVASRKAQIAARRALELADAQALAAKLAEVEISIAMQATEDDQLFGSVTPRMIADELAGLEFVLSLTTLFITPTLLIRHATSSEITGAPYNRPSSSSESSTMYPCFASSIKTSIDLLKAMFVSTLSIVTSIETGSVFSKPS